MSQDFDVIQSDVALQNQVYQNVVLKLQYADQYVFSLHIPNILIHHEYQSAPNTFTFVSLHAINIYHKVLVVSLAFCLLTKTRTRGYKTFFTLNSAEHEIYPAHKNNCWHFNIY